MGINIAGGVGVNGKIIVARNLPPIWFSPTGSVGTIYTQDAIDLKLYAYDPQQEKITYIFRKGVLPPGVKLNPETGELTGGSVYVEKMTTYEFTITAQDSRSKVHRKFGISISPNKFPQWQTVSGVVYMINKEVSFEYNFVSHNEFGLNENISYTIVNGNLPNTLILNQDGTLVGYIPDDFKLKFCMFTIRAQLNDSYYDRQFGILINNS